MENTNDKRLYGGVKRNGKYLGLYNLFHTLENNIIDHHEKKFQKLKKQRKMKF
jgi:hypothetical protein